jgi:hypothetical protein
MTIAEYKTVSAASTKELDYAVNRHLKMGFQPFGSPYVAGAGSQQSIYQALVKSDDAVTQDAPPTRTEAPRVIMPPTPPSPSA